MKKVFYAAMAIVICCSLVLPVMAAPEGPEITLQPQSPDYPNYSVAIYTVKAEGSNLSATWYMEWSGKTYTISNVGGAMQPWEAYAGESYGARKLDNNTFAFVFEGIERDLDGAYIWCVIEDGHYYVSSQKARICVSGSETPPEIVSIPAQLTVEQGAQAEIRCVAKSPDDSQLSFLWYETDTGKLEDMRAVNRGTETTDYMFCDTADVGTRNYICMVESSNGGLAYSSVVAVTVTEKAEAPQTPTETRPSVVPTTPATETQPAVVPTTPATETQPSVVPTAPAPTEDSLDATKPSSADTPATTETAQEPAQPDQSPAQEDGQTGVSWWVLILIGVAAAGIGVGAAVLLVNKKA